jgi:hypothetical protein
MGTFSLFFNLISMNIPKINIITTRQNDRFKRTVVTGVNLMKA